MNAISFPVESPGPVPAIISQGGPANLAAPHPGGASSEREPYPCPASDGAREVRWYELRGPEIRWRTVSPATTAPTDPSTSGPPTSDWVSAVRIEETSSHYTVFDANGGEHALGKAAMDRRVHGSLRAVARALSTAALAHSDPPACASPITGPVETPKRAPVGRALAPSDVGWGAVFRHWLGSGIRLALTLKWPSPMAGQAPSAGPRSTHLFALAGLLLAAMAGFDYIAVREPRWFYATAALYDAAWMFLAVVAVYLAASWMRAEVEPVLTLLAAALLIPALVGKGYAYAMYANAEIAARFEGTLGAGLRGMWAGWIALIAIRAVIGLSPGGSASTSPPRARVRRSGRRRQQFAVVVLAFMSSMVATFVLPTYPFWFHYDGSETYTPRIDIERTYYQQPERLQIALDALAPERPGIEDVYFVGFAGYADEDVFMREVRHFKAMFDERAQSRERSVLLINHPSALDQAPLANRYNLEAVLHHVGQLADPQEDTVFLYLTSHGTRDGRFAVRFAPLGLSDVTAQDLGRMLTAAGIGRRVIAVSACYSGTFIEPLKAPEAIVMSAAHAERASFGCANGRDFTYFGRALRNGLRDAISFVDAFELARKEVLRRERAEGKEASLPQISVGVGFEDAPRIDAESSEQVCAGVKAPPC